MSKRSVILIEVNGGVAEHTRTYGRKQRVIILDWDSIELGDEPGIERPKKGERSYIAKVARTAWKLHDLLHKDE